ncbi:copper uptake system-associated protein [Devosia sp.]|uniref:copper uptake system-associated protein n=1 Tax=Devosia sp. TaxID=1871048 RepID=UPI003A90D9B9
MKSLFAALALLLGLVAPPASAHEFFLDGLQIIHPAIPATPLDATTANIYMAIYNGGTEDERLLAIETPFGRAALERPLAQPDGSTSYEKLAWIDIPVGETVLLLRGEMRARISGVTEPLFEGGELTGTFVFEKRGRFKMFFMIDPLEPVEDPPTSPQPENATVSDRAGETVQIAEALRAAIGADAIIAPVALDGDFAIAGWSLGDEGARAVLRRRDAHWQVVMWAGPSLLLPATLSSLGVSATAADRLRTELAAGELALGAQFTDRFDAFPGTVVLPTEEN